jgi:hypothetical protein
MGYNTKPMPLLLSPTDTLLTLAVLCAVLAQWLTYRAARQQPLERRDRGTR